VILRVSKSDVVRHGALVFGGVATASVFNYLYYTLIARRAGVDTYGVVTALTSAMVVVLTPGIIGQLIAARLAADLEARHDNGALRALADLMTTWTMTIAAVVVAVGLLFRGAIASFFNLTDPVPVVMVTLALGVYAVVLVQRGILQGAQRFGAYAASSSIDAIVKVLVGVPLVGVLGATGGLAGVAVGALLALAYDLYIFRARFGTARAPITLDRALILRVVSHVGLGQLTFTVLTFYDVPLIKHAFDARSAGLYAAAALVGRAVVAAVSFVPIVVMPMTAARTTAGRSPLPLLGAALGLAIPIVAIAVLAALVAPRFVVTLIAGRAFGEAAPLVLLYAIASGGLSLANVVGAYKMGLHRYDFVIPCLIVAAIEISVIALWHPTLGVVVETLACGHVALFAATLFRVWAPNVRDPGQSNPIDLSRIEAGLPPTPGR
jgi:O-antigen/teichoic acid export membrane protein